MKLKIILCLFMLVFVFSIAGCETTETIKHEELEQQSVKVERIQDRIKAKIVAELYENKEDIIKFLYAKYNKFFKNIDIIYSYDVEMEQGTEMLICDNPDMLTNKYFSELDLKNTILFIPNKALRGITPSLNWTEEQAIWWYEGKYTLKIYQNIPGVGAFVKARDRDDIFLVKGLKGVDGDSVKDTLILSYAGPYTYQTAMGGIKTIHSFYLDAHSDFSNKYLWYVTLETIDEWYNDGEFFKTEIAPITDKYLEEEKKKLEQKPIKYMNIKPKVK